tara:strand:+ start:142 stop:609 length:468 start_codon:yes stop_codon:yes gene_type:complete
MKYKKRLPHIKNFGTLSPIPGFADWFTYFDEVKVKSILNNLKDCDVSFLKSQDLKLGDSRIIKNKEAIKKLVTHYIVNEKNQQGLPINDVSRFHLGNGAIVEDIVINANVSEQGFKRSYGIMVNYLYELKNIEKNHEDYMNNNKVIVSDKISKYL